ncbi:MAG: TIM barrel protein [Gemmatimonadetes bacterium]|jgi:mannonate dehydratase|nr:TIM barrel protein [Gemmatimonadota bacterium]MBT5328252.1 TIM barrel protein [Gemmatimonadota bacterium]MBT7588837.1 TIM barrel protein [Gemmatimonadota bacterium]
MYIGSQFGHQTDEEIQVLSQLGVINVDQTPVEAWKDWTTDALVALKERWAKHGISLEMLHIPLGSRSAYDNEAGAIFLKPSDERDRQIDWMKETVRMAGEAGIRGLNYNITILGHLRTPSKTGRGGATVSTFELDKLDQSAAEFEDGPADEDEMWERINHWLQEIIPVAEEYKVQMACHPSDPGIGVGNTYRGVARPLGMVDGFKKLIELYDSPYNGLNFCQGCMSESLENPAEEIFDVIRYFGERKKIFNVHFRNIKGGLGNFVEVFPDEGDIHMIRALKVYKDVGYKYMIMPDHVPGIGGPESGKVGFAYTYGYIHAALQAVEELSQ